MPTTSRRRTLGSYYTPDWIARWMVAQALATDEPSSTEYCGRILDPACGDGGFVLPVLDALAARLSIGPTDTSARLQIVSEHVFGVDADQAAIDSLRQRVAAWIGKASPDVSEVIQRNFRWGDALLGEDWSSSASEHDAAASTGPLPTADGSTDGSQAPPLHWSAAFPHVAAAGGFDLVIGNPPYRRELNAKSDFDRIAESTLGQRRRTARMDLWHYFLHRGLDLLKVGGRLSFVVNSYWTGATAAEEVRRRLADETTLEELVLLGSARLFDDVSGRHLIFQVRKGANPQIRCRVRDLSNLTRSQIETEFTANTTASAATLVPQADLWSSGQLRAAPKQRWPRDCQGPQLGDVFEVRQGIAENPPLVTRAAATELGDPALAGSGVFVLTDQEVAALELSEHEQSLLRPYYALSAIGRFQVAPQPTHRLLYLTRHTAPDLEKLPRIAVHLQRFRAILQRRREALSGRIAWWHLHWPREERLFQSPRVLCHQMGHEPRFAYAEQPTFVGFSLHVIVPRPQTPSPLSLAALSAILNSRRAKIWFETFAKKRGAHLDISGTVLKQFSLPETYRPELDSALETVARNWATFTDESHLNSLVDQTYEA